MQQQTYQVQLPAFRGPLDLLLHLIEQQQLDITTIALAQVTDQYLAYLRSAPKIAPDDLADFLAVAARLLLIKSRALLPQPPREDGIEEEDVGEDLVRQLREYKRFKEIALLLQQRGLDGLHAYPRAVPVNRASHTSEAQVDLSGTSLESLVMVLQSLLQEQLELAPEPVAFSHQITIASKIARIDALLGSQQRITFDSLLENTTSRIEVIVTLLAVLEMLRRRRISVRQERLFGEILILPGEPDTGLDLSAPRPRDEGSG